MTGSISGKRGADIVNRNVLDFFNRELKGTYGVLINGQDTSFREVESQPSGREIVE
ncbi:hypothetical protein [Paenibacillus sp. NPDC057934]|uniref:hypothetical protein n=1 Tax=Paenibacillus sp. NPDC057934 TaxID=3346282 RepID=UPI0036DDD2AA